MAAKDVLGRRGEDLAAAWAEAQGWVILARNWRGERGELDLVARDGDTVVVVEVKTRRSMSMGGPVAAVTPRKVRRLRVLTGEWLGRAHAADEAVPDGLGLTGVTGVRIDVIGVVWPDGAPPSILHVPGAG